MKLLKHINFKPKAPWAAIHDPTHHAFGECLNIAGYGKNKLFQKSWHVGWLVCVPRHSHISTFIMETRDKTTAMIALCLMLQSFHSFISCWLVLSNDLSSCCWESKSLRRWFMATLACEIHLELLSPEQNCVCQLTAPRCIAELMKCS